MWMKEQDGIWYFCRYISNVVKLQKFSVSGKKMNLETGILLD
ncbi:MULTISPECIES: hypothetical protein [Aminobacterium]|nr:hypothetical protein [Aminobacterium sp. UBA4834]